MYNKPLSFRLNDPCPRKSLDTKPLSTPTPYRSRELWSPDIFNLRQALLLNKAVFARWRTPHAQPSGFMFSSTNFANQSTERTQFRRYISRRWVKQRSQNLQKIFMGLLFFLPVHDRWFDYQSTYSFLPNVLYLFSIPWPVYNWRVQNETKTWVYDGLKRYWSKFLYQSWNCILTVVKDGSIARIICRTDRSEQFQPSSAFIRQCKVDVIAVLIFSLKRRKWHQWALKCRWRRNAGLVFLWE